MISSATSLLLLAALRAPADTAAKPAPAPAFAARVASAVGAAWGVAAERIRLEWGLLPRIAVSDSAPIRLVGTGAGGWYVVVTGGSSAPVAMRVHAGLEDSVVVAALPLATGHRIMEGDLRKEIRLRWGRPDSLGTLPAAGWTVRRALAAGDPAAPPDLAPPALVHSGDPVRFVWRRGIVEVELNATALHDAALGAPLRARGPAREALVGLVTGPGEARIEGGRK